PDLAGRRLADRPVDDPQHLRFTAPAEPRPPVPWCPPAPRRCDSPPGKDATSPASPPGAASHQAAGPVNRSRSSGVLDVPLVVDLADPHLVQRDDVARVGVPAEVDPVTVALAGRFQIEHLLEPVRAE